MESQNIQLRAAISFHSTEGANAKEIRRCIANVYSDRTPKY